MADRDLFTYISVLNSEIFDVLSNRRVEIYLSIFYELYDHRACEGLADGACLEECICCDGKGVFYAGDAKALGIFLTLVPDANCHTRYFEALHFGNNSFCDPLERGVFDV